MTAGLDRIKEFEGCRLKAYPDPASGSEPWTIGYGHTGGVREGDTITQAEADAYLQADVAECQAAIRGMVTVPLTDGQLWALTSFAFNLGAGALRESTLLHKLNAGDYAGAADQFGRWIFAGGKPMPGLVSRRAAERSMFVEGLPDAPESQPQPGAQSAPQTLPEASMPIPAIVAALLPSIVEAIPKLAGIFGPGTEVAERNVKAATMVLDLAQKATGAVNAQDAVEKLQADPAARQAVQQAVQDNWFALTEVGGGPAEAAKRDAAFVASGARVWQSPSWWAMVLLLPLVYMITLSLIGVVGSAVWEPAVRAALATAIITAVVSGAAGYYWGSATTKNRAPATGSS